MQTVEGLIRLLYQLHNVLDWEKEIMVIFAAQQEKDTFYVFFFKHCNYRIINWFDDISLGNYCLQYSQVIFFYYFMIPFYCNLIEYLW